MTRLYRWAALGALTLTLGASWATAQTSRDTLSRRTHTRTRTTTTTTVGAIDTSRVKSRVVHRTTRTSHPTAVSKATRTTRTTRTSTRAVSRTDINRASRIQLMRLPGVNGAVADRIIAGRPYASGQDLVTQSILTPAQFEAVRTRVMARAAGCGAAMPTQPGATPSPIAGTPGGPGTPLGGSTPQRPESTGTTGSPGVIALIYDINTATRQQLATMPGSSYALADKIIVGRPYTSTAELTSRGILTADEFAQIRLHVSSSTASPSPAPGASPGTPDTSGRTPHR